MFSVSFNKKGDTVANATLNTFSMATFVVISNFQYDFLDQELIY